MPTRNLSNRLTRLEARRRRAGPQPHDDCLELLHARQWAGQPAVLECFHGDLESCPHAAFARYCQRRDAHSLELEQMFADDPELNPPLSAEDEQRPAEGVCELTVMMTRNLSALERKLATVKGAT